MYLRQSKSGQASTMVVGTIAGIVTILGTVFAVSTQFVTKSVFAEFKEGTVVHLEKRMDGIDKKLDKIIDEQRRISENHGVRH